MAITPFPGSSVGVASGDERPQKNTCVHDELLADGSMVLYHTCKQQLMTINPTAALVWECCDGEHDLGSIADELRSVFPEIVHAEADILTLLETLLEQGMIVDEGR